jgi:methylenetetrahydrofolate reductase (NADPH)
LSDDAVQALLRSATLETAVKDISEIDGYASLLPAGTQAYVPWLPAFPYHHLVTVSARLARAGLVPVPHLAARRIPDAASAADLLARLVGDAGVQAVLLIGGDVERPLGPYDSAAAFLRSGLLQRHRVRKVGFAGYPEGHPGIPSAALDAALVEKIALADEAALEPFIVSQFCFEADAILAWIHGLRRRGIALPLRVGLAGPASMRTLITYGLRCGVGPSLRAIKSRGISLTRLVSHVGPEDIVESLSKSRLDERVGLHFFTFGGVAATARWMGNLASAPA